MGLSTETPFNNALINSYHVGLADGPTEVHKMVVAREVPKDYRAINDMFPSYLRCMKEEEAMERYGAELVEMGAATVTKANGSR